MAVVLLGLVEVRSQSIAHPQTTCLLVLLLMYMFLIHRPRGNAIIVHRLSA